VRAVILAAGRGSRLGTLGDERPKCLVELANKSLLNRQIAALRGGGMGTIGIVRGYCAQKIAVSDVVYFNNSRWSETNMVMSLAAAADWLRTGSVIVSYGDIFYRRDLVRDLAAAEGDLVVTFDRDWRRLWSRRFTDPLIDAETFRVDGSGSLVEIGGKTSDIDSIEGQYIGLFKVTPIAWKIIDGLLLQLEPRVRDRLDMTNLLRRLLRFGIPIRTLSTSSHWGEVDSAKDLVLYESMIGDGDLLLEE